MTMEHYERYGEQLIEKVLLRMKLEELSVLECFDDDLDWVLFSTTEKCEFLMDLNFRLDRETLFAVYNSRWIEEKNSVENLLHYYRRKRIVEEIETHLKGIEGKVNKINYLRRQQTDQLHDGHLKNSYQPDIVHSFLDLELEYWTSSIEPDPYTGPKLKWLGKPEQFGHIFSELARQGYIELPSTNNNGSYQKYASICYQIFDINTTEANLQRALNPEKNQLSSNSREQIIIPNMKDIS